MFNVSKALLISSDTVIVRTGRAIWLNHFATVFALVPMTPACTWWNCPKEDPLSDLAN